MTTLPESKLIAELRDSCDCSGLTNPSGVCVKCRAADALERLTAEREAWKDASIKESRARQEMKDERDRLAIRVAELLDALSLQTDETDRLRAINDTLQKAEVVRALEATEDRETILRLRAALERIVSNGGYGSDRCFEIAREALAGGAEK